MKNLKIILSTVFLLQGCGFKAPPDAFFATSPSNVQQEVEARKPKVDPKDKEKKDEKQTNR